MINIDNKKIILINITNEPIKVIDSFIDYIEREGFKNVGKKSTLIDLKVADESIQIDFFGSIQFNMDSYIMMVNDYRGQKLAYKYTLWDSCGIIKTEDLIKIMSHEGCDYESLEVYGSIQDFF